MSIFEQALIDIIEKIQIDENFNVRHPDYPPLEIESESTADRSMPAPNKSRQIPPHLQTKFLTLQTKTYLHDIYFTHTLKTIKDLEIAAQIPSKIENDNSEDIDPKFYRRLQASNSSHGYIDTDWQILSNLDLDRSIVVKDGLHLHIDRQQHLPQEFRQAAIDDLVSIYLPHNLVGIDTYIIIGNAGKPDPLPSIELYFNFTPDAAVSIAASLTRDLNKLEIPFQFAILHHPELFDRYDGGTLRLPQTAYHSIQGLLAEIYQVHQAEFSANVPIFTKPLAPGLGLAEVPIGAGEFGLERCQIIATGLLAAMEQNHSLTAEKLATLRLELVKAKIDLSQPYLNPGGIDRYQI
jgi:hypothetical protein